MQISRGRNQQKSCISQDSNSDLYRYVVFLVGYYSTTSPPMQLQLVDVCLRRMARVTNPNDLCARLVASTNERSDNQETIRLPMSHKELLALGNLDEETIHKFPNTLASL